MGTVTQGVSRNAHTRPQSSLSIRAILSIRVIRGSEKSGGRHDNHTKKQTVLITVQELTSSCIGNSPLYDDVSEALHYGCDFPLQYRICSQTHPSVL